MNLNSTVAPLSTTPEISTTGFAIVETSSAVPVNDDGIEPKHIGMIVGILIGVLVVTAIILFVLMSKRRKMKRHSSHRKSGGGVYEPTTEPYGEEKKVMLKEIDKTDGKETSEASKEKSAEETTPFQPHTSAQLASGGHADATA